MDSILKRWITLMSANVIYLRNAVAANWIAWTNRIEINGEVAI